MTGSIRSLNLADRTGEAKRPVATARCGPEGLDGDAHAGAWHRQISLLAGELIDAFAVELGTDLADGAFGENLTTSGIDLERIGVGDRLRSGAVELEVTQIGKSCHGDGCAIFRRVQRCIMPQHGVFARVLAAGDLHAGDELTVEPVSVRIAVFTLSDRAAAGVYTDRSGPVLCTRLEDHFRDGRKELEIEHRILPDDPSILAGELRAHIASGYDAVFTTGGTGLGPRDLTPETVRPLLERELPGIAEAVRVECGRRLPRALLSRALAGLAGRTLVYCLPGSTSAVGDYLDVILQTYAHARAMVAGVDVH